MEGKSRDCDASEEGCQDHILHTANLDPVCFLLSGHKDRCQSWFTSVN